MAKEQELVNDMAQIIDVFRAKLNVKKITLEIYMKGGSYCKTSNSIKQGEKLLKLKHRFSGILETNKI